ncbi:MULTISPECIES: alpha/beta fold hydrolase [unclassified Streptomyces]|uniref:alpha/beta fold hydrolase n=1 Tax=unclassified Streptomyces TaxID=2593676 RepID=UPI00225A0E94|nr:alpha/beta fold hydrolase [Streptomyces sp. NBC_01500]MCX4549977.1 alpha/beta hydrolase [Streptomyces sp. NBC_01500]WSV55428.1 alpha/beta hydrolase [Streptomyces sp. NBC_01014]
MQTLPTFVLVHGAFANSFSFAPLQAELALLGHRSVAVDLPGHGFEATFPAAYQAPQDLDALAAEPGAIKGVTLADNAARVIEVLERAKRNGPTVLVAHSRGGITATAVANARPELIDRIVYVSAWCPVDLDVNDYYAQPEMADVDPGAFAASLVGNPAELGLLRTNFRTADPAVLAAFKRGFAADLTDDEFRIFLNTFQPDENLDAGTSADRAQATTWGRVPKTYVRLEADASIPLAVQDRMIREANALTPDNPFDVRTLEGSHLRWLVHPKPAAGLLADLADLADPDSTDFAAR